MSNGLWITPDELGEEYADLEYAQEACESASFILWALSGRRFSGLYSITERYTLENNDQEELRWYALASIGYSFPTRVYPMDPDYIVKSALRLRGTPVRSIEGIYDAASGDEISTDSYQLYDHAIVKFSSALIYDLDVAYTYGALPPTAGKMAARQLAIQYALLWSGHEDECTLPETVTSVTREGVSWTMLDRQDFIEDLRTGVYAVDLFLKSVNPDKARAKAKVFSPDIPRGRRKTTY